MPKLVVTLTDEEAKQLKRAAMMGIVGLPQSLPGTLWSKLAVDTTRSRKVTDVAGRRKSRQRRGLLPDLAQA